MFCINKIEQELEIKFVNNLRSSYVDYLVIQLICSMVSFSLIFHISHLSWNVISCRIGRILENKSIYKHVWYGYWCVSFCYVIYSSHGWTHKQNNFFHCIRKHDRLARRGVKEVKLNVLRKITFLLLAILYYHFCYINMSGLRTFERRIVYFYYK